MSHGAWNRSRTVCVLLSAISGCSDCGGEGRSGPITTEDAGETHDGSVTCSGAAYRCEDNVAIPCEATGEPIDCSEGQQVCNSTGCGDCVAGETTCQDGQATWCRDDGTLALFECDVTQGLSCEPDGCKGPCALNEVHDSYIGCDYYPTVTLNPVWSGFAFAIAVSNASDAPTHVTITRGDTVVREADVAAFELETFELDWIPELKGGDADCAVPPERGPTRLIADGAYRVRTDYPVTVYQFSPLEYELDPAPEECQVLSECSESPETRCLSYSNDASLLLPATALTGNYTALAWPTQVDSHGNSDGSGFLAITAVQDGTQVQVLGSGEFVAGAGIDADGRGTVTLDRGDVLQLVAASESDPSGTRVRADKPVQVIGGQSCAYVPSVDVLNCDHIEQAMLPEDTLGSDYLVTLPVYADLEQDTPQVLRVAAIEDATQVSFDPAIVAPVSLAAGQVYEIELAGALMQHVRVMGDKPVLVATYMEGQEALPGQGSVGDPSMSLAVPIAQYRADYLFTAPSTYDVNIANVVAKLGASVHVDDRPIDASDFVPIGGSEYGVAHVRLDRSIAVHTLSADQEVGLTVYGYGQFTSYMYPGGADLERITIPPIL